jgi:hypothetical protein
VRALSRRELGPLLAGALSALAVSRSSRAFAEEPAKVLGRFSTRFLRDPEHRTRAQNLGIAAAALDQAVIAPGAVFSFNDRVGERTARLGYEPSVVYKDAQLAQGTGGGTCQVASTFHGAALLAGLGIFSRTPHTRPSAYIRMGLDATVVYPQVDLKIRNDRAHAVTVRALVVRGREDSRLDVWIEGEGPRPAVSLTSEIEERTPASRSLVRDEQQPDDVVLVRAYGIPGYRVRLARTTRSGEDPPRQDERTSEYPETPEVLVVSPSFDEERLLTHHPHRPQVKDEKGALHPVDAQLHPATRVTIGATSPGR